MRSIVKFLCTSMLMVGCIAVHGDENENEEILECICDLASNSIKDIEEEKVYLKPESLHLHEGAIFILNDHGNAIHLPYIYSNTKGPYLVKDKRTKIYICRKCTRAYYNYKPDKCERCWGADFIVRFQ